MTAPDVRFEPNFLSSHVDLFNHLISSVKWDGRMKARKTASFGVSYDYSQISYAPAPMPSELLAVGEELSIGTGVAIVSLGSMRSLVFKSKADKTVEIDYPLPSGSLIYMPKEVQDHWLHAIPKIDRAGPRISLTFRSIIKQEK